MGWRSPETKHQTLSTLTEGSTLIVFDLETTGLHPEKGDRPIEIGAIRYRMKHGILTAEDSYHSYLNPGFAVSEKITELTGIAQETLDAAPGEEAVFDDIYYFFENGPTAAFNAPFDVSFMESLYQRNHAEFTPKAVLDVLVMARDLIEKGQTKNFKLGTCAEHYGLCGDLSFHSALDDATATGRLISVFLKEYPTWETRAGILQPDILSVSFWEGYHGFSRIYVSTSQGEVFYDVRNKDWNGKNPEENLTELLDMPYVVSMAYQKTQSRDEREFARFKGKVM